MTARRTAVCAALVVCGLASGIAAWRSIRAVGASAASSDHVALPRGTERAPQSRARTLVSTGRLPLLFEKNQGQSDGSVAFLSRGLDYQLFLRADGATWVLQPGGASPAAARPADGSLEDPNRLSEPRALAGLQEADVVRMRLIGSNPDARATAFDEQAARVHYFRGNDPADWRTQVPTFGRLHYQQVYPGVDLEYYGREGALEYDFVVAPGVDPAVIALGFEGAGRVSIDEAGDLVLETRTGRLLQRKPIAYQYVAGERRVVESTYVLNGDTQVGFEVATYDRSLPLVIDPVVSYSTFLGGSGGAYGDHAYGVAADANDNVYITGKSASTIFPAAGGQPASADVFVVKMTPDGALAYVAVINGNGSDSGEGIAVDAAGQAIVTGFTDSTNFPLVNPVHPNRAGRDAFALKLDPTGVLVYSTYLGGSTAWDYGEAVAVDGEGNAYLAGTTKSSDFPVLTGLQPLLKGQDAFVVKLDPAGNLLYGTFLGGTGNEVAESIAVDDTGSFYVAGWTSSSNFPRAQSTVGKNSGEDAFVSQFTPDGSAFVYSRYLGGNSHERAFAITLDGEGGVFVAGRTDSTNFPLLLPLQGDQPGTDAFLTRLGAGGDIWFSTYLGGDGWERILGLAVRDGRLFATGQTFSTDFLMLNAVQPAKAGDASSADAFVTTIDVVTSLLMSSTYLGGAGTEEGRGVAPLPGGNTMVVGWTESADFPTVRPIQDAKSNVGNVFITRFAPVGVDGVAPEFVLSAGGEAITITGQDFVAGATVLVGGAAATGVSVLDGSTMTATTPALPAAGTVDITVVNPDGGSGTLYGGLMVLNGTGPIADAGPDQTVEATSASGATVVLNGTASFDPDNEPMNFTWYDQHGNVVGTGSLASAALPIGVHTITLVVSDGHSAPGTDTVSVRVVDTTAPVVTVMNPNGGEKIFTGTPAYLEWTASDAAVGLSGFDVYVSANGGSSFGATPICANVPATERGCVWASPGPATGKARIRVVARDAAGNTAFDNSNGNFTIASGTAWVNVTAPNTSVNWAAGSTQQIKWTHNVGAAAYVRLEFTADGGTTWSLIDVVKNSAGSSGVYNWTLPNVLTFTARIRVSWAGGPVSDESNADFTIAAPFIQLGAPGPGANWGYGTTRTVTWATNLGQFDRVDVVLSTDGGITPAVALATGLVASAKKATFETPTLGSPTAAAQVRVVWSSAPAGFAVEGVSPGLFQVEPAFITVTFPDGGLTWAVGTSKKLTWSNNLGTVEKVLIELSQDDGASYPIVMLAATPSDGVQAVKALSSWVTNQGRIRISWVKAPLVNDASNGSFVIQ